MADIAHAKAFPQLPSGFLWEPPPAPIRSRVDAMKAAAANASGIASAALPGRINTDENADVADITTISGSPTFG